MSTVSMASFDFVKDIVSVINSARDVEASSDINKQASEDMFNGLLRSVPEMGGNITPEEHRRIWEANLRFGEDAYCEENFADVEEQAKHQKGKRKGEWKYRTLLPGPYTSAKSVIGKALERGVDVRGKGKSQIQKESNEAASEGGENLDAAGKFKKVIDKAFELMKTANNATQEEMFEYVREKFQV